jgi:hypothetical protein
MGEPSCGVPPSLQRRLNKILDQSSQDSRVWSKDLQALSALYKENTAQNRRNLRSIIERSLIESNDRFVQDAEALVASIDRVDAHLGELGEMCDTMSTILSHSEVQSSSVLNEIEHLERCIDVTESKKDWFGVYQEKYQLPKDCRRVLMDGSIHDEFFDALKRVQLVHSNCRSLGLSYHHRAGLALLEELSTLQDEAFRHVCSWVRSECQSIESPNSPEVADMMPKAMKSLRSRPPLYSCCAEEIALARKTAVFQKFIHALSQGPRPIEMHAADPWRYANDMLAWVHAAIASEMELLGTLFEGCYSSNGMVLRTESVGGTDVDSGSKDEFLSLQEIMDTIFESVCRPLKLRLEQILLSAHSPVLNFQLITLFGFYINTIGPVMGEESKLLQTLGSCRASAEKALKDQMKQRGERLVRQPPLPPADLSMPEAYGDRLGVATSILKFYEGSLLMGSKAEQDSECDRQESVSAKDFDFESLLESIIHPIIDSIFAGADVLDPTSVVRLDDSGLTMNPSKQHIYVLNCLSNIRMHVEPFETADSLVCGLKDKMRESEKRLAAIQSSRVMQGTGLDTDGEIDAQAAASAATAMWSNLQDPSIVIMPPEYFGIIDQRARERIERDTIAQILDRYLAAYHTCAGNTELLESIHTPEDIKTLLGG